MQIQKGFPFMEGKGGFGEQIGQLLVCPHKFEVHSGVNFYALDYPIEIYAMGPRYVPKVWAPTFYAHFDYRLVVFEKEQLGNSGGRFDGRGNEIDRTNQRVNEKIVSLHIGQILSIPLSLGQAG